MIKKKILVAILVLFSFSAVFAQEEDEVQVNPLVERYLNAANTSYENGDLSKAFDYINFVFGQYTEEAVPLNVETLAETIYFDYLTEIYNSKDEENFYRVKDKLDEYPTLSSERITRLVRKINNAFANSKQYGDAPVYITPTPTTGGNYVTTDAAEAKAAQAKAEAELKAVEKELAEAKALNQKDREAELLRQKQMYERFLKKNSSNTIVIVIVCVCIVGILIGGIILIVSISKRSVKTVQKQQEQFEATLQMVAQLSRSQKESAAIARLPDWNNFDENAKGTLLVEEEISEDEQSELQELANQCKEIGAQIDEHTGRKNNSKNVSEMVFKIANQMHLTQREAMLDFCASMIYDVGFLSIDKEILSKPSLTDDEKYIIRSHVQEGVKHLEFVPDKYKGVFLDAVLMHHENMDGSGYSKGVLGNQIPQIARIIHVVESFIALISRRNYRGIFDKDSAIEELKAKSNLYDESIVEILDTLI